MTNNASYTDPGMLDHSKAAEFAAFESLPEDIRQVIREAPFDVSAADMIRNRAVMDHMIKMGEHAAGWLKDALAESYRNKILPQALISASS